MFITAVCFLILITHVGRNRLIQGGLGPIYYLRSVVHMITCSIA